MIPLTRVSRSAIVWLLLGGCVSEPTLLGDALSVEACREIQEIAAPETGCRTVTVTVPTDGPGCNLYDSDGAVAQRLFGSWIRVRRAAHGATQLRFDVVSLPRVPTMDGPDAPYARLTGEGAPACGCHIGALDSLPLPAEEPFEWALTQPSSDVLLSPPGAVIEVSLCTTQEDPYPACHLPDVGVQSCPPWIEHAFGRSGYCVCAPGCVDDASCPAPSSGTAVPRCVDGMCVLGCDPSATAACPTQQECVAGDAPLGAICMSR